MGPHGEERRDGDDRRDRPCDDLKETIKGLAACSTDVRLLTQTVSTLAEQFKRHMDFNDTFMPKIQGLVTDVELLKQCVGVMKEDYKVMKGAFVSIVVALIIAGIIAAVKWGGGV